jgi:hypothetical protein
MNKFITVFLLVLSSMILTGCGNEGEDLLDQQISFMESAINSDMPQEQVKSKSIEDFDDEKNASRAYKNTQRLGYGIMRLAESKNFNIEDKEVHIELSHEGTKERENKITYGLKLIMTFEDEAGDSQEFTELVSYSASFDEDKGWYLN